MSKVEYLTDVNVIASVNKHWELAEVLYPSNQMIVMGLQGSQNYGVSTENSDVDTKLLLAPSLEDIYTNRSPVSHTHICENKEHIDLKDVRLYTDCFRKQNINFLEILYTNYLIINPLYIHEWNVLKDNRELICKYDIHRGLNSIRGQIENKYNLIRNGKDVIKNTAHIIRFAWYAIGMSAGADYEICIHPNEQNCLFIKDIKNGRYDIATCLEFSEAYYKAFNGAINECFKKYPNEKNKDAEELLYNFQKDVILRNIEYEMERMYETLD